MLKITEKTITAALLTCLVLFLSACGGGSNAEPTPLPTVQLEPAITAPPTPTPTPKPSIGPYFEPTVTKSPGPEEKVEGSCIYFSSFAEDAVRCEWEIIADDGYTAAADAPSRFEGLFVAGAHDSYLVLGNIPMELNGWSVRCKFVGTGEATVYSDAALITVLDRTVKIHGEERKTVKGTGNVEGYGAVIDYEGENWWAVEEYSDSVFTLMPRDADPACEIKTAEFNVYSDGSVSLVLGEKTYLGKVDETRLGGYSASATVKAVGSDEEITVFFDYTALSQKNETWDKIFLQLELKAEPVDSPADEAANSSGAGTEDSAETGAPASEAEENEAEEETVKYEFILTRQ